jgi:hypothetical protein
VIVGAKGGEQVDLQCGPQDRSVRVTYEVAEDAAAHTAGKLRGLTFGAE